MSTSTRILFSALLLAGTSGGSVYAQTSEPSAHQGMNHEEHAMGGGSGPEALPAACNASRAADGEAAAKTEDAMAAVEGTAGDGDAPVGEAQSAYRDAMMKTHAPMMEGAMASDPDVAFVCSMIPHHEGAVAMAKIVLQYGKDDFTRRLAEDVVASQQVEIDQMREWLEKRGQ
ncbi:DUF305 domain-containing protein [Fulvimarina sp. MAC8]|uniref:CopM family metallochaperone n=1 Tax=Fulvimarina sp. MAC8 TaxID=3162874 RepID=UPI0032EACAE1